MSFLYVIATRSTTGPVKLGYSDDPDRRRSQLQTGHAEELIVHHTCEVGAEEAPVIERLVHRSNSHRRLVGEWFRMDIAQAIIEVEYGVIRFGDVTDLRSKVRQGTA